MDDKNQRRGSQVAGLKSKAKKVETHDCFELF